MVLPCGQPLHDRPGLLYLAHQDARLGPIDRDPSSGSLPGTLGSGTTGSNSVVGGLAEVDTDSVSDGVSEG